MMLELNEAETFLLREILDGAFRDLRVEIADTDNSKFKSQLRSRETVVEALLGRVGGPLADQR